MKKNVIQKFVASVAVAASLTVCAMSSFAADTASHYDGMEYYIPKTCSDIQQKVTGKYSSLSFRVTKILDGKKKDSGYQRIRAKVQGPSGMQWIVGGTSGNVVTGSYSNRVYMTLKKGTSANWVQIFTGTGSSKGTDIYYYGNNPDLDAYATICTIWE